MLAASPEPPSSTYRLQLSADFDLTAAAGSCEYLEALGVGAAYCSPILAATPGSPHGYDTVDHDHIDGARGGEAGWHELRAAAEAHELGVVVDIVPNHMGVADARANAAWWDVLRLGERSPYACWFDIDWSSGRIRLPVLGDGADPARDLGVVDGELRYGEHRFPLAPGSEPTGPDTAPDVHGRQHYELVNFRRADVDQNYRRFFAVSSLAGLRIEDERVADATHRQITRWVRDADVVGLRVDHPDGLADPDGYLRFLRAKAPTAWITVEKILEPGETLPVAWPVAGTTGYDALAEVGEVFTDPAGRAPFDQLYRRLTGDAAGWAEHMAAGKRFVATTILRAEVSRLARLAPQVTDATPALVELLAAFPTYRSYLPVGADRLDTALAAAGRHRRDLSPALARLAPRLRDPADELCRRFQQTSGAVMAKGVEDSAYYRYTRFVASNEVGGDPDRFGASVEDFHRAQLARQAGSPAGMTTLSTHDTKRGEDVRAHLAVLAELPGPWAELVTALMTLVPVPNARLGYLLWQTFVGAGFIERSRMHGYAQKAMREASEDTNWVDPDERFEEVVHAAVDAAYGDPRLHEPLRLFRAEIAPASWSNSLAQKLVQLTMPGVPDVYQGSELWEDNLVDPDNRRPVDLAARAAMLRWLDRTREPPPIDASGAVKLWLVSRTLRLRRDHGELFSGYRAVPASGPASDHVVAFDRGGALTVATRLPVGLAERGGFGQTSLPLDGAYTDILTAERHIGEVRLAVLLRRYPVALLVRA